MDAENNQVEKVTAAESPVANGRSAALWRLILLGLCSVGAILLAGILVLQVVEYRFYKAAPDVWPQAGGTVSAPTAPAAPALPATAAVPVLPDAKD